LLLAAGAACAADRPDLNGTWQFDASHNDVTDVRLKSERLSIAQKVNSIEISDAATESNGKERKSDIECNVEGQECNIKDNGQPTKVTFYYNGPILVVTEMRHGKRSCREKAPEAIWRRPNAQHRGDPPCARGPEERNLHVYQATGNHSRRLKRSSQSEA
jgi:hypothetical protein